MTFHQELETYVVHRLVPDACTCGKCRRARFRKALPIFRPGCEDSTDSEVSEAEEAEWVGRQSEDDKPVLTEHEGKDPEEGKREYAGVEEGGSDDGSYVDERIEDVEEAVKDFKTFRILRRPKGSTACAEDESLDSAGHDSEGRRS